MPWTDPFLAPRHKVLKRSVFLAEMHKGELCKSVTITLLLNARAVHVSLATV